MQNKDKMFCSVFIPGGHSLEMIYKIIAAFPKGQLTLEVKDGTCGIRWRQN